MRKEGYIEGIDRKQLVLFPDAIDDYITSDNPVRFIDAFVDTLDLISIGFTHSEPSEVGRPPYNPADLLKLYIYGYLNQVRTSRKLERECARNVEAMWLMKRLTPDFKTIADFRKDNVDCVKKVFGAFVRLCRELDLFGSELISVDGSKFRAVNSKERNFNREKLESRVRETEERIERYLREMDENDSKGETAGNEDGGRMHEGTARLDEKIEKLKEKKGEYERLLRRMDETGGREISLTDPDSRMMMSHGRLEICYNVQTAVDSKNKLIADYEVVSNPEDLNQLAPVSEGAKEALSVEHIGVVADRGYFDRLQLQQCVDNGITPLVPKPRPSRGIAGKRGIPKPEFYDDRFVYDDENDTYTCPEAQVLHRSSRSDARGKTMFIYSTAACYGCPFIMTACTTNRKGRHIFRWEHEKIVETMITTLKSDEGREKFGKRKELSEHPFGTMKRAFNQGYMLLRGLKKVRGETGFTMIAYDMRRAINIAGTARLIAAL